MTKLKEKREQRGLSRSQLATKTGISLRTIEALEQGLRPIEKAQVLTVIKLADALDCSVYDLINIE